MVDSGNKSEGGAKFVCPNDRQLALRAKLRTGWSAGRSSGSLGADEQASILAVIRRAEQLDHAEQERVGRLVDRLENMKRRVTDRGPRQCRLCGQPFGLLGPTRVICADCRRSVCAKCAVEPIQDQAKNSRDNWLCKICSETREMWKKSGAWFFKGLPKYVLPDRVERKSGTRPMKLEDGSSSEDEKTPKDTTFNFNETLSTINEAGREWKSTDGDRMFSRQTSSSESHRSGSVQECGSVWEGGDSLSLGRNDSVRRTPTRKDSVTSNWSDDIVCKEAPLGWLELSLMFDRVGCALHCSITRARDLPGMDSSGHADPFCKMTILPTDGQPAHWLRTKTVHKTRNPEFNEALTFYGVSENDLEERSLHIILLDDDKYGFDFLGGTQVALNTIPVGVSTRFSVPLVADGNDLPGVNGSAPRGQMLLSLCYNTKKRSLVVLVKRCVDLAAMDSNGFSDPFVKIQMKPDSHHRKHKTSIKWRTLNPYFNEEFLFETRPTELAKQSLILTVWDKDYGKSNDFLGGLEIGPASKGRRLKQWRDCIRFPDHRHEQWHCLSAQPPGE